MDPTIDAAPPHVHPPPSTHFRTTRVRAGVRPRGPPRPVAIAVGAAAAPHPLARAPGRGPRARRAGWDERPEPDALERHPGRRLPGLAARGVDAQVPRALGARVRPRRPAGRRARMLRARREAPAVAVRDRGAAQPGAVRRRTLPAP